MEFEQQQEVVQIDEGPPEAQGDYNFDDDYDDDDVDNDQFMQSTQFDEQILTPNTNNTKTRPRITNTPQNISPRIQTPVRAKGKDIVRLSSHKKKMRSSRKDKHNFNKRQSVLAKHTKPKTHARPSKEHLFTFEYEDLQWDQYILRYKMYQDSNETKFTKREIAEWKKFSKGFPEVYIRFLYIFLYIPLYYFIFLCGIVYYILYRIGGDVGKKVVKEHMLFSTFQE